MKQWANNLSRAIFYLILLFLPTQLGRHFWPQFAIIGGIRVDYLSPTVYFTDLLIILLFLTFVLKSAADGFFYSCLLRLRFSGWFFIVFILSLVVGIVFSKSPLEGLYGFIKLLEFLFFGIFTANFLRTKHRFKTVVFIFSLGAVFESILSVLQYLKQESINGLFYFFGERFFTSQTPGVANASINGELVLRPYGTFSHPNVLAAYLLMAIVILVFGFKLYKTPAIKIYIALTILTASLSLFIMLSRVVFFLWFVFLFVCFFWAVKQKSKTGRQKAFYFLVILILILAAFFSPFRFRFSSLSASNQAVADREFLDSNAFLIFAKRPIFGVGVNNYFINLSKAMGDNPSLLFQPPHNIFLLVLSETGIMGLAFFLWFVIKTYKQIIDQVSKEKRILYFDLKFLLVSFVVVLGFFDHFFLTLQQGQLVMAFVFGLIWSRLSISLS